MPTLQENKSGGFYMTIPVDIVKLYGWKKGDKIEFFEERPGVPAVKKVR